MKLFKRRLKKNNRGLSLVELICAVAILGLATTAVGSAMVVSAQNYQRNTVEFNVQQEAQTTTNLIGNLVVDSVNADWNDIDTLQIDGDGVTYYIKWDEATGILSYIEDDGSDEVTGVLAENVTDFHVDDFMFASNKNVKIDLEVTKNGKKYEAVYNSTARNGVVSNSVGAVETAVIEIEEVVEIEPGQMYKFPIEVNGMTKEQVGGFIWDFSTADPYLDITKTVKNNNYAEITLADTATGSFTFTVRTTKESSPGVPLDVKMVTVNVRRVNDMLLTKTVTGAEWAAGTVYRVDALVDGENLDRDIGASYDAYPYEYKETRYVDFEYTVTGMDASKIAVTKSEDQSDPYIEFKLLEEMPIGARIDITATAKHPEGEWTDEGVTNAFNKASAQNLTDDPYGSVVKTDKIEHPLNGPWPPASGLKRGDFQYWIYTEQTIEDEALSYNTAEYDNANQYYKYMRIWEVGSTPYPDDSTGWILLNTTGDVDMQIQQAWSSIFLPDKAYNVELMLNVCTSSGEVKWPEADTDRNLYITSFIMEQADIRFKCEEQGISSYVSGLGSESSPMTLAALEDHFFDVKTVKLNYQNLKDKFVYKIQKYDGSTGDWEDYTSMSFQKHNGSADDEGSISLFPQTGDVGKYRALVTIDFPYYSYSDGSWNEPVDISTDLYNLSTGEGVFYFNVTN